jgi:hypothetical protein
VKEALLYRPPPPELLLFAMAFNERNKERGYAFRGSPEPSADALGKVTALSRWRSRTLSRFANFDMPMGIDGEGADSFLKEFGLTWVDLNSLVFRTDPRRAVSSPLRSLIIYLPHITTFE